MATQRKQPTRKPERGEPRFLTDLQLEIMELIWAAPKGLTPREVSDAMHSMGSDVEHRTVLTVAIRLREYGILELGEEVGRSNRYIPTYSREEYVYELVLKTVRRFQGEVDDVALQEIRRALRTASTG